MREKVKTVRGELSAERDCGVLAIARENAPAAVAREREYADQRVADLRASYERGEPRLENIDGPSTAGKAAVAGKTAKTKTRSVGKAVS